jgi:hypothetical protein
VESITDTVVIENVNGPVSATDIEGNTRVTVVNGQIEASVTIPSNGYIIMNVANGSIDLGIPQETSAQFSATVAIGDITISSLSLTNETTTANSVTGTLGSGDGTISLVITNGSITVTGE